MTVDGEECDVDGLCWRVRVVKESILLSEGENGGGDNDDDDKDDGRVVIRLKFVIVVSYDNEGTTHWC